MREVDHYKHSNKLGNLNKMDNFPERNKLP